MRPGRPRWLGPSRVAGPEQYRRLSQDGDPGPVAHALEVQDGRDASAAVEDIGRPEIVVDKLFPTGRLAAVNTVGVGRSASWSVASI